MAEGGQASCLTMDRGFQPFPIKGGTPRSVDRPEAYPPCMFIDLMTRFTLSSFAFLTASVSAAPIDFSHQIVPILREHCSECHTGDKKKGGVSMNDREALLGGSENGPVVVSGQSAKRSLVRCMRPEDSISWRAIAAATSFWDSLVPAVRRWVSAVDGNAVAMPIFVRSPALVWAGAC